MKIKCLILFIMVFVIPSIGFAQGCIDALSINSGFPCPDPTYRPVCGCDGKTYRHECEARYRNGIQNWTDGPCSGFEIDIIPTFVTSNEVLRFTFVQNTGRTATFVLLDYMGQIVFYQTIPASDDFSVPFVLDLPEVNTLHPGPYIIMVYNAKGTYRYKKFVKI